MTIGYSVIFVGLQVVTLWHLCAYSLLLCDICAVTGCYFAVFMWLQVVTLWYLCSHRLLLCDICVVTGCYAVIWTIWMVTGCYAVILLWLQVVTLWYLCGYRLLHCDIWMVAGCYAVVPSSRDPAWHQVLLDGRRQLVTWLYFRRNGQLVDSFDKARRFSVWIMFSSLALLGYTAYSMSH